MKKRIKAILIVLLFVVLISPIKLKAMQPVEPYPVGIVVEIDSCDPSSISEDKYYVDVVVEKEVLTGHLTTPNNWTFLPDALKESEYADVENEWISILLFSPYNDWEKNDCSSIMFAYLYSIEELEFTEFKIVIYEQGESPVESKVYFTSNLATYEDPTGFKIIYSPQDQLFSLQGYETEYSNGYNGMFDWLWVLLAVVIVIIVFVFGLMESLIYLIARQGKRAALIPLGFNLIAFGYVVLQSLGLASGYEEIVVIVGLLLVPGFYAGKILLLYKYETTCFKVSILFSVMFYAIYLYLAILLLR